jgi:hypothetical protein
LGLIDGFSGCGDWYGLAAAEIDDGAPIGGTTLGVAEGRTSTNGTTLGMDDGGAPTGGATLGVAGGRSIADGTTLGMMVCTDRRRHTGGGRGKAEGRKDNWAFCHYQGFR